MSRDYDECVIYHPPIELSRAQEEAETKLKLKSATVDLEYIIHIKLQLQECFGKGTSSLASITLKSASNKTNIQKHRGENCTSCKPAITFEKAGNQIFTAAVEEDRQYLMTSDTSRSYPMQ